MCSSLEGCGTAHPAGHRPGELSGHQWPLVTEGIQDGCLQRPTARARFNEGLPAELSTKVIEQVSAAGPIVGQPYTLPLSRRGTYG
jgi:hypothetical protein